MKRFLGLVGFYLLVAAIILYAVFPFYYAIVTSLKAGSELFSVDYFPVTWNWDNYVSVFREQP
ncbi:MAG: carbohydrate ABC transporter permease, partial [Candidatus Competibacteraceae bacterium]|nr:carbohydrate ABC transporter permease [Candidatus Competibacteraceae bacterium]